MTFTLFGETYGGTKITKIPPKTSEPSQPSKPANDTAINGVVRVWTEAHEASIFWPGQEPSMNHGYKLADNSRAYMGDVMIDGTLGMISMSNGDPTPIEHCWESFRLGSRATVDQIRYQIRIRLKNGRNKARFYPAPALAPYFNERGDFIGNDPNMTFSLNGHKDQISKWQLSDYE